MHNGAETDGDFDPTVYGWRTNGDYGILNSANLPYPTFYAEKLLQYFARPGDVVLNATSDNLLLSAYAVQRTNGALTLLVINKDMTTNLSGEITLTNYVPWRTATVQSYGIPQDQAAQNHASASQQDIVTATYAGAGANFTYDFPPLSLTLFTFAPGPATLSVSGIQSGQVLLSLQGQAGGTYAVQESSDLITWTSVTSTALPGNISSNSVSLAIGSSSAFYRAVWQP